MVKRGKRSKIKVKLESWGFACKMFIFALIFKNSKMPKADLSYESPDMFKFYLRLKRAAQYCSKNERPKIQVVKQLESYEFASKMLIFALIFKNSKLPKADLSYKSPHVFKFYLHLIRAAQYCSKNEQPKFWVLKFNVKQLEIYGFASKMLIFALNCQKQIYHTNLPMCLNFTYVAYRPHNTALKMNKPKFVW